MLFKNFHEKSGMAAPPARFVDRYIVKMQTVYFGWNGSEMLV